MLHVARLQQAGSSSLTHASLHYPCRLILCYNTPSTITSYTQEKIIVKNWDVPTLLNEVILKWNFPFNNNRELIWSCQHILWLILACWQFNYTRHPRKSVSQVWNPTFAKFHLEKSTKFYKIKREISNKEIEDTQMHGNSCVRRLICTASIP